MAKRAILLIVVMGLMLGAAMFASLRMWGRIEGGPGMDVHGVAALAIGAIGTVALGGGLMALVFFSSRRGYDENVGLKPGDDD
jgi:hypothetical protein